MKKVVIITSSLHIGGAERNAINLALNLKNPLYTLKLLVIFRQNEFVDEFKDTYIPVSYLSSLSPSTPKVVKLLCLPAILWRIIRYIMVNEVDLVIAGHEYNTCYLTTFCGIIKRIPSILIIGNNIEKDLNEKNVFVRFIHKSFLALAFRISSTIISVSYGITDQLQRTYKVKTGKIATIYNGVIISQISEKPKKNTISKKYIVISGRLIKRKGHHHLLKVVWFLRKKYNLTANLLILGNGNELTALIEFVKYLELEKQVKFITNPGSNYYYYVKNALLSITCSEYEGFGNVIIESMKLGTPVICTDCRFGPREILDDNRKYDRLPKKTRYAKYGILIPPLIDTSQIGTLSPSEIELALAIKKLLNTKSLQNYYKKIGKKRGNEFTLKKMVEKYDTIIINTLNL